MNLPDFYRALKAHDWTYYMSDDHGVYLRGTAAENQLSIIADEGLAHGLLFKAFKDWRHRHITTGEDISIPPFPFQKDDRVKLSREGNKIHNPKHYRKPPLPADWIGHVTRVETPGLIFVTVKWDHQRVTHKYAPNFLEAL